MRYINLKDYKQIQRIMHSVQMFVYFLAMTLRWQTFKKVKVAIQNRSSVRNISLIYSIYSCNTVFPLNQKKKTERLWSFRPVGSISAVNGENHKQMHVFFFLIGRRWCHHMCKTVINLKTTSFLPLASVSAENSTIAQSATKADSTRKRAVFLSTMIGLWMLGDRLRTCFIYTVFRRLRL